MSVDIQHVSVDLQHVSVDIQHVSVDIQHVSVDIQHVVTFEPIFKRYLVLPEYQSERNLCVSVTKYFDAY